MQAILATAPLRARRAAALFAAALLAGCDGPSHAPPVLPVTVTAVDATGPLVKGQTAVFTFTVSNPSSGDVPALTLRTDQFVSDTSAATSVRALDVPSVACVARQATCPVFTTGLAGPFTLPAGGVLTLTVSAVVDFDYAGTVDQEMDAGSTARSGDVDAHAHVVLADAREGYYELFTTSGLRTNLDVRFQAGATKFAVSSGAVENTFVEHQAGYVFASGLVFKTGPDILVGQANFGHGPETFIGARNFAGTVPDLDGLAFTVVGVTSPSGDVATSTVRTMAVSGATLTACVAAAPHAIATCPPGSLRHYALVQPPGDVIFTATDAADNDSFSFQVFHSGDHLLLLQADLAGTGGVFAVGFSDAAVATTPFGAIGAVAGTPSRLALGADSFSISPIDIEDRLLSQGATAALAPVAGGPTGLVAGVRASDNAALLMLQQSGLLLVSGPAGELDALIDQGSR